MLRALLSVSVLLLLPACADHWVGPEVGNTPVENFDLFWQDMDRHYSHFAVKDIDWNQLYEEYRPQVNEATGSAELFDVLCAMSEALKDGHVNIITSTGQCGYSGWRDNYPHNFFFNQVKIVYLNNTYTVTGKENITYGRLSGGVGYVHIAGFSGSGWADDIDVALRELGPFDALVVDVRDNGGGSTSNAESIAGRFADQERLFSYYQYRNGPGHSDFTELKPKYVKPEGEERFTGPIALLTNRGCFSACENFTLAMDGLPNVTIVGDTTGGGFGNPLFRELPNGWTYRFPVWIQSTHDGRVLEGIGIAPDVPETITSTDIRFAKDAILEKALEVLGRQ